MRKPVSFLLIAVLATAVSGFAQTQKPAQTPPPTLAELAKKEAERRKKQKSAPKTWTNKDLPPSALNKPPVPPAAAPAPAAGEAAPADPAQPAAPPEEQKDEAWWKARIGQAREDLRRNEMFAEALQTRINALTKDFTSRDNPAQRAKVATDRDKAIAELERVRSEIERNRTQIAEIEEEARKAGVPPGWLR